MTRHSFQRYWESIQTEHELGEDDADSLEEYHADQSLDVPKTDLDEPLINEYRWAWENALPGYKCVLQHVVEDWGGYEKTGWFLLVNYECEFAIIVKYDEGSYYSSQTGICCKELMWQGSIRQLLSMAELKVDPSFPKRRMIPDDHYYTHWRSFYEGIIAWAKLGKPDWSNTSRWGPIHEDDCLFYGKKTPFSENMKMLYEKWSHAATIIQAAWRAWTRRLFVLWNPSSPLGNRRLALEAAKATNVTPVLVV